jgi:two-component system OmpR family response regulator
MGVRPTTDDPRVLGSDLRRRTAPARALQAPASPRTLILLVEDDPAWGRVLTDALASHGHGVRSVASAAAARAAVAAERPDLIVLDLTLPDEDGLVLCADLKAATAVPVLICSLTRRRRDVVLGLRLGADDFVARPCDLDELVERVGVLLRSRAASPPTSPAPEALRLQFDQVRRRACLGNRSIALSAGEYRLLAALAERHGRTIPRQELASKLFGQPEVSRALDTAVWRLRAKLAALGPDAPQIATSRGAGYRLLGLGGS